MKNGTTTINSFTYSSSLAGTDGVSMNRSPDASATGTFVLHTTVSTLQLLCRQARQRQRVLAARLRA